MLRVNDASVPGYLKEGFDQVNENGQVIKKATGGRTVSLAEYNRVVDRLEKLRKQKAGGVLSVSKNATKAEIIAEVENQGFKLKG